MPNSIRTNQKELVEMAVQGQVMYPRFFGWEIGHDGTKHTVPSVGGIVYNVKIGDPVYGLIGDHVEPCVTATASSSNVKSNPNTGFNVYSCIGNTATVISGKAKGGKGQVTGHHGGVEHVMIDFPQSTLEKMDHDSKILIRTIGLGLKLIDYPDVRVLSLDPKLLKAMPISENKKDGSITVPVAGTVPAYLMGSGLGSGQPYMGDYDIQTSDRDSLKKLGLEKLRFGDLVAIEDHQCHYGYAYKKGARTIGVVVHGDSYLAGHGPGVQVIMTCNETNRLQIKKSKEANIGHYLKIGRWRQKKRGS